MKIAVQILYTESWVDIAKIVVPNTVRYCTRHGYLWHIHCVDSPFNPFEKLSKAKSVLKDADVVVSLDADTLITNHNIKVEDIIGEQESVLYIAKDYNGINAGVFILQRHYLLNTFLERCLLCQGQPGIHCEQDAFVKWVTDFPILTKEAVTFIPQKKLNAYMYELYPEIPQPQPGQWETGDFIIHLPGVSMEKRKDILSNIKTIE